MSKTCQGTNANGSPCSFKARFSSNYCAKHAHQAPKPCPTNLMTVVGEVPVVVQFKPAGGGTFTGSIDAVNALLTAMGYAKVAARRQLMSKVLYLEAEDTPIYCSPASETYWSM